MTSRILSIPNGKISKRSKVNKVFAQFFQTLKLKHPSDNVTRSICLCTLTFRNSIHPTLCRFHFFVVLYSPDASQWCLLLGFTLIFSYFFSDCFSRAHMRYMIAVCVLIWSLVCFALVLFTFLSELICSYIVYLQLKLASYEKKNKSYD